LQQSSRQIEKRMSQKDKTLRAFQAYLVFLDAAQWMRSQMRAQLESFGLTMGGFRLLELLYREGSISVSDAAELRDCKYQNMVFIVGQLQERGWVHRELVNLPPASVKSSRLPKAKRRRKRVGRRVAVVRLTPQGEKFIGAILPKHTKVVKALMRVLDGREQETLTRLCLKLREGDVRKFASEMMHEEVDDQDS